MTEPTVRTLSDVQQDFLSIHSAVGELSARLALCQREAPRCKVAARQLRTINRMLAHVLDGLDADILAASERAQSLAPAPF